MLQAKLPEAVEEEVDRQIKKLERMHPDAAEAATLRNYLDVMVALPWSKASEENLDLKRAQTILDEDHYDLEEIKARILEYLAVRELRQQRLGKELSNQKGAILCFVGPPGVGKTSLGRSIARAMDRKFIRVSLGGVRDEAEVRGHRRTYIGAMPGTIIQTIKRVGVNNPVFMLDEIDKLGSDFRGDPSSALLEVLDPEQNIAFRDHYLDVAWDLSPVMFIATANNLQTIPPPLLDRMEVIQLSGYTLREKLEIAKRYLLPRQLMENGIPADAISVTDAAIREIIRSRVYQEVDDYNRRRPEVFRGLVEPTDAEKTLNGYKLRQPREIDWKRQFEAACEAYARNAFLILVDDTQAGPLDEEVTLRAGSQVTFLRMVPLVGG